ncbi:hypothetical protein HYFRA_00005812 [Hymenoscyphus fraxineus]|uniref:Ubiquitin carboxyl-terminal hydrolase n=1 Tax=Hymenoscyphus fraxineus TaxID=746836 RepID=A0A9N9KZ97_9HELO|nr:hypothetical protein HYFRA_00005812 [Hymenoscyphus fraxineus]
MPSSRPSTPATVASPMEYKLKDPQPGIPFFGCPHIGMLLTKQKDKSIQNYRDSLRAIFEQPKIQTSKTVEGQPFTTLTPNYLCLQCNTVTTEKGRKDHGDEVQHRFCKEHPPYSQEHSLNVLVVESRNGYLYCQMCHDFVFDPTMEDLRLRKSGRGTFTRKRKLDELFTDPLKDDPLFISTNTVEAPCRASGIRGIYNMGATCYMNVILQCFVHNPLLRNFYLSNGHLSGPLCPYKNCMSCAMDAMYQEFYAEENTTGYSASSILASFWLSKRKAYEELASNKEQDAHEFFQFLTEELHEINGGTKQVESDENSNKVTKHENGTGCKCIVHQTFYGKLQSTITCQSCGEINTSVESFLDLSLGLEGLSKKKSLKAVPLTLQRCLDEEYCRPERCEYTCNQCGTLEAKKQLSIKSLPNVLCIQLKRFKQNNGTASKIDTKVSFPLKLEMFPYTNRAKNQATMFNYELARSCTYDLQSVVVHVGNLETGHYVSYSRVGNQWFKFNDHNVTLASKSQVLNEQAFLLFYVVRSLA